MGLLDEMYELGAEAVKIIGGEPLLYPELVSNTVKHARGMGMYVSLETNGTMLTEEIAKLLDRYEVFTHMTIYAGSEEGYRQFGGREVFQKVVKGLKILSKIHMHQVKISVIKINLSEFDKMLKLVEESGVKHAILYTCIKIGRATVDVQRLGISDDILTELYDRVDSRFKQLNDPRNALPRASSIMPYCFAINNLPYIAANGDVYPCPFSLYPVMRLGNIYEEKLGEILGEKSEKMRSIKNKLLSERAIRFCDYEAQQIIPNIT